jgi:SNF2 family DNA or RNA helicase
VSEPSSTRSNSIDDFVGNPAAGGTGVDGLQASSLAVYYNNSFNAEHRWQSEGRIHRIGTTESVLYLDLVVPRSVDTLILKNLRDKNTLASSMRELLARPDILRDEYTPAPEEQ